MFSFKDLSNSRSRSKFSDNDVVSVTLDPSNQKVSFHYRQNGGVKIKVNYDPNNHSTEKGYYVAVDL